MKFPLLKAIALCVALVAQSVHADETPALRFDWKPGMRCSVEQTLTTDNPRIGTQSSSFHLAVAAAGTNLKIAFTNFELTAMSVNDTPEQRVQGNAMGRAVIERQFTVTKTGTFLRAEPVASVRKRLKSVSAQSGEGMLILAALGSGRQEDLDREYKAEWQVLVEAWAGLAIDPARTQPITLEIDGLLDVTVSAPRPCAGAATVRCTTLVAATPEVIAGRFPGSRIRHELEVEPDTLIPRRWSEESWTRPLPRDGVPMDETLSLRRERRFNCSPGN